MVVKIYVRERQKVKSGVKSPKFRVIAVTGTQGNGERIHIEATHFRKKELEMIAKDTNSEIVFLDTFEKDE